MSNRIDISKADPAAYKAMLQLTAYTEGTALTRKHKDLIKIRASQINGCAFCIDMHTRDARATGETEQRIYALSAWRDTNFFDEQERALLAFTEEVTLIQGHVSDETYSRAAALFDETYLSSIILAVIAINGWNRIAITTHLQPVLH
ncbi:MAG: carboxymuconolactone decarboxylase family protein [Mucilaginibacter sp.]